MPKRIQLIPLNDELIPLNDDVKKQIISCIPEEMAEKANRLLESMQKAGIYVSKDENRINYIGKAATGSPILDLIRWALSKEKVALPPDYKLFKKILKEIDLPANFLPTKEKKSKNVTDVVKNTSNSTWINLY
jgi:hypothetical protein